MPKFIALPVGQGDAFYLDRDECSILVDGGRSRLGFADMFRKHTHTDGVDILVCTHNDADHSCGILGFLQAGLGCREVWLPGRWLSVLPDVLRPFAEVFLELVTDVERGEIRLEEGDGIPPLELLAEEVLRRTPEELQSNEGQPIEGNGWPSLYVPLLESAETWDFLPRPIAYPWFLLDDHSDSVRRLLWSAIEAAERIRTIALEAFHRGIPVRWFEFNATAPAGGIPELEPVNAKAVVRVRPRATALSLFHSLSLTVSNRQSLVFWSAPAEMHPGVLFTADSDLVDIGMPPRLGGALATAPHHGSAANANAYQVLAEAQSAQGTSRPITWVRSDGRFKNRPGKPYLQLPAEQRLCTMCRLPHGGTTVKREVRFLSQGGLWTRDPATLVCSCV